MIVTLMDIDEGRYRLCPTEEYSGAYKVDVTLNFWERYQAYEAEEEFIQSKLHRYYEDCRLKEKLESTKKGAQPLGFDF